MRSALAILGSKCWIEFDRDAHIIAYPQLAQHRRANFLPHPCHLHQKMPLLAVSIG